MKKIYLITLLTLLSIGGHLQANILPRIGVSCWRAESEKVKNHYKGLKGGYIRVSEKQKEYVAEGVMENGRFKIINKTDDPENIKDFKNRLRERGPKVQLGNLWHPFATRHVYREADPTTRLLIVPPKDSYLLRVPGNIKAMHFGLRRFIPTGFDPIDYIYSWPAINPSYFQKLLKRYFPFLKNPQTFIIRQDDSKCYEGDDEKTFEKWKRGEKIEPIPPGILDKYLIDRRKRKAQKAKQKAQQKAKRKTAKVARKQKRQGPKK